MWKQDRTYLYAERVKACIDTEQDLSGFDGITDSYDIDDYDDHKSKQTEEDYNFDSAITTTDVLNKHKATKLIQSNDKHEPKHHSLTYTNLMIRKESKYLSRLRIEKPSLKTEHHRERLLKKKSVLQSKKPKSGSNVNDKMKNVQPSSINQSADSTSTPPSPSTTLNIHKICGNNDDFVKYDLEIGETNNDADPSREHSTRSTPSPALPSPFIPCSFSLIDEPISNDGGDMNRIQIIQNEINKAIIDSKYIQISVIFLKELENINNSENITSIRTILCYGLKKIIDVLCDSNLNQSHQYAFNQAKICRAIIAILLSFETDLMIQFYCLTSIYYLCHDEVNQIQFGVDGVCQIIVSVMHYYNNQSLLPHHPHDQPKNIDNYIDIDERVNQKHGGDIDSVQLCCCKAIWVLSSGQNRLNIETFGQVGCFKELQKLIKIQLNHSNNNSQSNHHHQHQHSFHHCLQMTNGPILEWSCRCMINLTVDHEINAFKCGQQGCMMMVLLILKKMILIKDSFSHNIIHKNVQEEEDEVNEIATVIFSAIRVLLNLTVKNKSNREECRLHGGFEIILLCMKHFKLNRDIQLCGIVTLDNLIRDYDILHHHLLKHHNFKKQINQQQQINSFQRNRSCNILRNEICETVVYAMRSFSKEKNIQLQGCRAIYFLTNGKCVGEARAAVRAALRSFSNDQEIMEEASDALGIGVRYATKITKQ